MKLWTALAGALLALACAPAYAAAPPAQVYGPPAPVEAAPSPESDQRLVENLTEWNAEQERAERTAWRKFWIGQGLVAADIALTCAILADGGRELNPLFGRNASCGRIAAIKGGVSLVQYLLIRNAIRRDPVKASKGLNIVLAVQGVPVAWNLIQVAK